MRGRGAAEPSVWTRGPWRSIQVNVDALGHNIVGDAANEPSIAIDPTDPCKMVIGWRQFDTIESDFRQAGWAYSHDRGETWTFPGSIEPGTFGSDPVLDSDADGVFYYLTINTERIALFRSFNGGVSWDDLIVVEPTFWDKPWMTIDRTNGIGRGNIYISGGFGAFTRSTDGGETFVTATADVAIGYGTTSVGPHGELYLAGVEVKRSLNAQDPAADPTFETLINLRELGPCLIGKGHKDVANASADGNVTGGCCGICHQDWVATDHSDGPYHGNVYVLSRQPCINEFSDELVCVRSRDAGVTWDHPRRVNDERLDVRIDQAFAAMSVAPNGRIDVVWIDPRNTADDSLVELFYSFATDGGETWSKNRAVSPVFDICTGRPGKLGDYYGMISDNAAANVAYAATFNGEHDVYFLRVGDCNENGLHDSDDLAAGTAYDCNENALLDECELGDADGNEQIKLRDFAKLGTCFTGTCGKPPCDPPLYGDPCCAIMDFDADGDVDLTDFGDFHGTLTESN